MNISEISVAIVIQFHLEHHWDGGLAAFGSGPDRIRTLVSMAIDSSHRVHLIFFILVARLPGHT